MLVGGVRGLCATEAFQRNRGSVPPTNNHSRPDSPHVRTSGTAIVCRRSGGSAAGSTSVFAWDAISAAAEVAAGPAAATAAAALAATMAAAPVRPLAKAEAAASSSVRGPPPRRSPRKYDRYILFSWNLSDCAGRDRRRKCSARSQAVARILISDELQGLRHARQQLENKRVFQLECRNKRINRSRHNRPQLVAGTDSRAA